MSETPPSSEQATAGEPTPSSATGLDPAVSEGPTRRRLWLYGASALVAAGAGLAFGRWRHGLAEADRAAADAFWASRFDRLDGSGLSANEFRGRPLLLNFWATWCPPCVHELPLLNSFFREKKSKGWQLLAVAIDKNDAVARFLERTPLDFSVAMAGIAGTNLPRSLGNASGGLPFTVVFAADGTIVHRKMGQLTPADLAAVERLA